MHDFVGATIFVQQVSVQRFSVQRLSVQRFRCNNFRCNIFGAPTKKSVHFRCTEHSLRRKFGVPWEFRRPIWEMLDALCLILKMHKRILQNSRSFQNIINYLSKEIFVKRYEKRRENLWSKRSFECNGNQRWLKICEHKICLDLKMKETCAYDVRVVLVSFCYEFFRL